MEIVEISSWNDKDGKPESGLGHKKQTKEAHAIKVRMQLGDLLVRGGLITVQQLEEALRIQGERGGRLGAVLVDMGALDRFVLNEFLTRMPKEPADIAATGIEATELVGMLMKAIYTLRLESVRQFAEAIKLPYHIVLDLVKEAVDRQLLQALGTRDSHSLADLCYSLTEQGKQWTLDALEQVRCAGPVPVTLVRAV